MILEERAGNLTERSYWNDAWESASGTEPVDPRDPGRWNFPNRVIERRARGWLSPPWGSGQLLELGCARSLWLPYFARALEYSVTGLDYSELGCEQARQMLSTVGASGRIMCCDFFTPPDDLLGRFDVVFSNGVVEHFEDTAACVGKFARFLAPGGRMVTIVPNVAGALGMIQKLLNKPVYDKHIALDSGALQRAHTVAGLKVEAVGYLVSAHFGVLNLAGIPTDTLAWRAKQFVRNSLSKACLLAWFFEEHVASLPATAALGAYVYCIAAK